METQHSIECAVSGEVQDSEGVFLDGIVLYVYSEVSCVLELAHAHVGHRRAGLTWLSMSEVIGQETQGL